jgi:hypothetical protein
MVYECEKCGTALPSGVIACPQCGEAFDEAVPTDAEVPKKGFSVRLANIAPIIQTAPLGAEVKPAQPLLFPMLQLIEPKQAVGLLGAIILFVGTFAPIVSFPVVGSQNYFQNGKGDGTILIGLAVVSALLALLKKYEGLWLTGVVSFGVLAFTFFNLQAKITGMDASMQADLADNPFAVIGNVMLQSIQLQWGWAVLVIGTLILIAAAAMRIGMTSKRSYVIPVASGILLILLVSGSLAYTKHQKDQFLLELKVKSDQEAQSEKAQQNAEQTEQQAKQDAVNKLNLLDWRWDNSDQFSRYLVGSVRNDSDRNITFVSIEFDLLDASGNKVGSAEDIINSLSPGEAWKFRAMAGPETASRAQLSSLKGTVDASTNFVAPQAQPIMPALNPNKANDEQAAKSSSDGEQANNNLKILGQGIVKFQEDHDENFPPMNTISALQNALKPYVSNEQFYVNPDTSQSFAPNPKCSGIPLGRVTYPSSLVVMYDAVSKSDGSRWILYADGHTHKITSDGWTSILDNKNPNKLHDNSDINYELTDTLFPY